MINNVSIIIKNAQGDEGLTLGIRTAYAAQSGGYATSLVLMKNGIYNLTGSMPDYLREMISLFVENEGQLYYHEACASKLGVTPREIVLQRARPITSAALADLIDESDTVNVY